METGSIREVVLGFENMVGNIPSECSDFHKALEKLFAGFYSTMKELLPLKYFALCENEGGSKIAIFDKYKDCKEWMGGFTNLCGTKCSEITFSRFAELTGDDLGTSNYYSDENGILTFKL